MSNESEPDDTDEEEPEEELPEQTTGQGAEGIANTQTGELTEAEAAVVRSIEERGLGGGLAWVFQRYSPEQFNEFIQEFTGSWQESQQRSVKYRIRILLLTFGLIVFLFLILTGLTVFTDSLAGESIVFFAGTLVGYFARLANELM